MVRTNNNKRRRTNGRNRARGRRAKNGGNQMIPHPPQLKSYGITREGRIRFQATAAATVNITYQNLLDAILIATGATTAVDLFEQVRVNTIELWSIAAVGTPSTCVLIFAGTTVGAAGDQKVHTDTSVGVEPAHVKASPDRLTQAGQFQPSSADTAFTLEVPAGTVIDVSLTYRQPVEAVVVATQNVLVAATAGAIYYRGLDGKTSALTNFSVVGVVATI